ncbi:MAG: LysR substrate-binding domain-containing protein [Acetobacteraceae bacterium]
MKSRPTRPFTTPTRRLIPPLSALIAFEAAARLGSFTHAAAELFLTQGAVSRRVATLEAFLGVEMFERNNQRVFLTPAGRFYADEARVILTRLAAVTGQALEFHGRGGVLKLAVPPSFATAWLIPRLAGFSARHADISVTLSARLRPTGFTPEGADAAIQILTESWPDAISHAFLEEAMLPVACPHLVRGQSLRRPADLRSATLLMQETRPLLWEDWFAARNLGSAAANPRHTFEHYAMVIRAALAGLGVAIVPTYLVQPELESGALVGLFGPPVQGRGTLHLIYPDIKRDYPPLAAFRDWLLEVAAPGAQPERSDVGGPPA